MARRYANRRTGRRRYKRRTYRRRSRRAPTQSTVYRYKQIVDGGAIVTGTGSTNAYLGTAIGQTSGGAVLIGAIFTLSQVNDYTDFTALYDQYKIDKVVLHLQPASVATDVPAGSNPATATVMWHAIDYDDATVTGLSAQLMQQYQNVKYINCSSNKSHSITIRPHTATAVYQSAFNGYANTKGQWLDCASPSVQYYGWKALVEQGTAGSLQNWRCFATYYMRFRNVR